jgi:hypothetical protein
MEYWRDQIQQGRELRSWANYKRKLGKKMGEITLKRRDMQCNSQHYLMAVMQRLQL